jgi:hypothetical protein
LRIWIFAEKEQRHNWQLILVVPFYAQNFRLSPIRTVPLLH